MIKTNLKTLYAGVLAVSVSGGALAGTVTSDGPDIILSTKGGGFQAATADGDFSFKVDGRLQLDFDHYDGVANDGDSASGWESEIRRARVGFTGTAYKDWHYNLVLNLVQSTAGSADHAGYDMFDNAFIKYTGFKWVNVTVGRFKAPIGLEAITSSKWISTIERSMIYEGTFADGVQKKIGVMANGNFVDQFTWAVSAIDTDLDKDKNATGAEDSGSVLATTYRFTWSPIHDGDHVVHFGFAHDEQNVDGEDGGAYAIVDTEFSAHLLPDDWDIDKTAAGTVDDDSTTMFEAAYLNGPFSIQSEIMSREVEYNDGTPTTDIDGWYVQGAWTLTGESRTYKWKDGKFDKIKPKSDGGAWELVAKYETLEVDYGLGNSDQEADVLTLGLNWYPNQSIKVMFNYLDIDTDNINQADVGNIAVPAAFTNNSINGGGANSGVNDDEDGRAITARVQYVF